MKSRQRRVVFLTSIITHYRLKFHELLRARLEEAGIRYDIIYGEPDEAEASKNDTVEPDWATRIPQKRWRIKSVKMQFHPVFAAARGADLVILGQENKHLQNYLYQMTPKGLRPKLALMGHGRNFQSRRPDSAGEKWKRFWATKVDYWFGYTEETRRHVESLGFAPDRITVFNNSVDTSQLRAQVAAVTDERLQQRRAELGLVGRHVGVFVGGIYPDKRMTFLIEAADRIRESVPDFELLVVGGGSDLSLVSDLARDRPWVHVLGPRFGQDKVELMMLGHVFMMPGLMGLAILDAGVVGLPVATTAYPWHSPEIAYLQPGISGLVVEDWENPLAYAREVADLLHDPVRLGQIGIAAREMADRYSIERMADNFANGILKALAV
ncbi:glycosyltransferase family 4 protein [Novosphingobium gossypii]|uniref:glycosyltransferase family 4 protein n=1 Tax=Novosphingobium gossypii TaxID=1604774 RepID=UPI003D2413AE